MRWRARRAADARYRISRQPLVSKKSRRSPLGGSASKRSTFLTDRRLAVQALHLAPRPIARGNGRTVGARTTLPRHELPSAGGGRREHRHERHVIVRLIALDGI